jgi:DUF1680 family protein
MRLFASLSHYLATGDGQGLQIHHFAPAELEHVLAAGARIKLSMATEYPWQGSIRLQITETGASAWAISLRVPAWSQKQTLSINGEVIPDANRKNGYLVLEREWRVGDVIELDLHMQATLVASNPRIDATRDCLAIQRGPLVYCLEDHDQAVSSRLLDLAVDKNQPLLTRWAADTLGGVMLVEAAGQMLDPETWHGQLYLPLNCALPAEPQPIRLVAIPYYAWGNRGIGAMRVWIPKKSI